MMPSSKTSNICVIFYVMKKRQADVIHKLSEDTIFIFGGTERMKSGRTWKVIIIAALPELKLKSVIGELES